MWCRGATASGVKVVVDRFHATQDRLRINLTPVPDGQYVTKLATAIRSGDAPDLVDIDDINSMLFIFRGVFTDLTPLVDALPYRHQLSPGHLRLATRNGRIYGVPYLADNSVLWYNTELLARAGVDPAKAVTTSTASWMPAATTPWAAHLRLVHCRQPQHPRLRRAAAHLGDLHRRHDWHGRFADRPCRGQPGVTEDAGVLPHDVAGEVAPAGELLGRRDDLGQRLPRRQWLLPLQLAATVWARTPRRGEGSGSPCCPAPTLAAPSSTAATTCASRGARRTPPGPGSSPGSPSTSRTAAVAEGWLHAGPGRRGHRPVRAEVPSRPRPAEPPRPRLRPVTLAYNLLYNQPDSPLIAMFRRAVFGGDVDGALRAGQQSYDQILLRHSCDPAVDLPAVPATTAR